ETEQRRDWAKRLFPRHEHVGCHVCYDCGLKESAPERMAFAAVRDVATFGDGVGDVLFDFGEGLGVYERTLVRSSFEPVPYTQLRDCINQLAGECLIH